MQNDNELRSLLDDRILRVCRQLSVTVSAFDGVQSVGSAIGELSFSLLIQKNPHEQPLAAHPDHETKPVADRAIPMWLVGRRHDEASCQGSHPNDCFQSKAE